MTATVWVVCVVVCLAAGAITTVAGMGGGLVLLLVLAWLVDPVTALAVTAPALLVGNVHRVSLYWRVLDRGAALRLMAGAFPGAVVGGLLVAAVPVVVIEVAMVVVASVAVAKALGWLRFHVPAAIAGPYGIGVGVVAGTSGGAGLLVGPFLLARGLTGPTYVGSAAAVAATCHLARLGAYGATGIADVGIVAAGLGLAVAVAGGNLLGDRIRRAMGDRAQHWIQVSVMAACVGFAVAGVG